MVMSVGTCNDRRSNDREKRKGEICMDSGLVGLVMFFLVIVIIAVASKSLIIIRPHEKGLYEVLGSFRKLLSNGLKLIIPGISRVIIMDLRTQPVDVPRQEVITKDNSPTNVDAIIYIRVVDPWKSYYEVTNYLMAVKNLAMTTLRSIIGEMELDEILSNRDVINHRTRDQLDSATDPWGVKVESVEIKEVDPVPRVKAAMEEQTSAERERRAAILRAEGSKKSAILEAEGLKRSRILEAEGFRTSQVLEAEGQRMATILEAQGSSQRLRLLSHGATALDHKALTYLSLKAFGDLGQSPSTKFVLPFEITRLISGVAKYTGMSEETHESGADNIEDLLKLEEIFQENEHILGPIPSADEIRKLLEKEEQAIKADLAEVTAMVEPGNKQ